MAKIILIFLFLIININFYGQTLFLVYPKAGIVLSDTIIHFKWNPVGNATFYQLQISNNLDFSSIIKDSSNISLNDLELNLNYENYYWRIRYNDGTNYSLWTVDSFVVFSPINYTHIKAWYCSDFGIVKNYSNKVSSWLDKTGNGNNLLQNDSLYKPIYTKSSTNNDSIISFDGLTQALETNSFTLTQPYTIFILFDNRDNFPTNNYIFDGNTVNTGRFSISNNAALYYSGNYLSSAPNSITSSINLINICIDSINSYIRNNQVELVTGYAGDNNPNGFTLGTYGLIGSNETVHANFDCFEIIIYDSLLDIESTMLVEQYLIDKYAPPANLGYDIHVPYGFCDTTIDAGARFTDYQWSTDTIADTLQTISVNQSGLYSVTVTDIFGFQSTDTIQVYFPTPAQLSDTAICIGDTIIWNCGIDTSYRFLWSTGDTTPQINIWQQGNYYFQITDSFGCKFYSDTAFVKVDSFPQTASLGNDTSLCAGVNITLASGNAATASYLWSTGDTTQYITINSAGNFAVTVTDTLGCIAKDTVQIAIHGQAPIPGFTWQNICLDDSTQIMDSSYTTDGSNIISWQWQLPDTTLTTQNISVVFPDTGTFPVTLTINTDSNCSNIIQKQVTIHSFPEAYFSTTQLCDNTPINFSESVISIDSITSYLWNFGDGSTDSVAYPIHWFSVHGNYEVSFSVVSLFGCKDSTTATLEIKQSPVVDFSHSVLCTGKQAVFSDLSVTTPVFPIINWQWDFGDGSISTSTNPVHIYSGTGTFVVSLSAQSLNGCSQTKTDTVTVYPSPQTGFYHDTLCAGATNQFTDSTIIINDSVNSWAWYINNALQSVEQNPKFYFQDSGTYIVLLITQTTHQCKDSVSKYLTVFPAPSSDFSFYPEIGTPIYSLSFTPDSGLTYFWDFGDLYSSTEQNPLHLYSDTGDFIVSLITTNNYGCSDTTKKTVMVVKPVYDVAIIDYGETQTGNYLSFSCKFLNMGSLPLDSVNLTLQIHNAPYFMEKWTGHILPGEIVSYQFSTNYQISSSVPEVTCVEAKIPGQTDPTPENNLKCNNSSDDFIFYTLYPNPTENLLYFEFNNPDVQAINVQIVDKLGRIVFSDKIEKATKGFNRFKINISQLEAGTYTVKIFSNIDKQEKQFMVY